MFPEYVKIVEVGPRDGLQNEKNFVATADKIEWINQLSETGLSTIEVTSFVSSKWIPQLSDHREVFLGVMKKSKVNYPVLVPNVVGMENALAAGVTEIAVFTTPSEMFSERNTHCSVTKSLQLIDSIVKIAYKNHIRVRGYVSCVLGCPYEGVIHPERVVQLAETLFDLGVAEISLGDTIGVGTPHSVALLLEHCLKKFPIDRLAIHFHDTYGLALVNIYVALQMGIHIIDSSVSGLGGCPYAVGAAGNVATEDVVYLLHSLGIQTGIDLKKLILAGHFINQKLGRHNHSKVALALGE